VTQPPEKSFALPSDWRAQVLASARVLSVPMRVRFRGLDVREVLLFEGNHGWAEWSPFVEYDDAEAVNWLRAAVEFGFSSAPAFAGSGSDYGDFVRVNATLPAVAVTDVAAALAPFGDFEVVKIKVAEKGQTIADDLARVREVHRLWPATKIRLDANGGYSVAQTLEVARALTELALPIEYLEQPVATVAELAEVRAALQKLSPDAPIKVAADESVRKATDPLAVAQAGAADILVLKAAPLGGINAALDIAHAAGLPVVVSSALETSVGISMGAHLAAALNSPFASGLATAALLADDVTDSPLMPIDGKIAVRRIDVNKDALSRLTATEERTQWWLARLERCLALL
jgi:O-succinylbenzoate synthase